MALPYISIPAVPVIGLQPYGVCVIVGLAVGFVRVVTRVLAVARF